MNLARMLKARADEGRPVRVGVIGAGKFGSMFLSQVRTTPGMHLYGIADLSIPRARAALDSDRLGRGRGRSPPPSTRRCAPAAPC